jgi:hypothetical protein
VSALMFSSRGMKGSFSTTAELETRGGRSDDPALSR